MDPMMLGMFGLGLGQDIFGGLSQYEQARRQRQQYDYAKQFQNPQWVLQQSQPYINQLNATLRQQLPAMMRQSVNPMLGSQGIDPTSGAGQSIYANAIAPLVQQNTQTGIQDFLSGAGQGQQYAGQNIGSTYGSGNGLQQALMMYYMSGAGRQGQQGQPQQQVQGGGGGQGQYGAFQNMVEGPTMYPGQSMPYTSDGLEGLSNFVQVPSSTNNYNNFGVGLM